MRTNFGSLSLIVAVALAGCADPAAPWQNANPNAKLGADVQRCRAQTGGPPPQLLSDNCGKSTGSCTSAAPLPQDSLGRQTSDYEACLAKLGWHR